MKVYVSGKNDNLDKKEIRAAIKFYGKTLLTERLFDKIKVYVKCNDEEDGGSAGPIDDIRRPRVFEIYVNPLMGKRRQLITLAHEMVHIKQFAKDELKYNVRRNTDKWLGEHIDSSVDYFDKPWEIEAFGRELGLYIRYMNQRKK
jgi:hypothetical protein